MPGYTTKQETLAIAGVDSLVIRSLLDRQQYADPLGRAARMDISSASWPLFGLAWPSGTRLAERLALRPVDSAERILEIGCGLGLASLVGHRRGADMTASDCHPLAEAFLQENLRLNGLAPMKYRHGHWSARLPLPAPEGDPAPERVSGLFDLIIGSDLLYERDRDATLATFIARHAAPAAEVWVVDPNRGNQSAFNRQMAAAGFGQRQESLNAIATPTRAAYKGRVLIYARA